MRRRPILKSFGSSAEELGSHYPILIGVPKRQSLNRKSDIRNKSNVLYDRFQFFLNLYEAKRSELESNIGKIVEIAPQDGSRSFILPEIPT